MKNRHLSALLSVLLLVGLFYMGDPGKISETLGQLELRYIILVIALYFLNVLTKNLRWCVVLDDIHLFRKALPLYFMGLAVNSVTPGRVGGEPFRAYLLNRNTNCRFGKGIASVFTEKVMDIILLVCFSILGIFFIVQELGSGDLTGILAQLAAMVVLLAFILYIVFHPTLMERIARRLIALARRFSDHRYLDFFENKLVSIIENFKESLREFMKKKKNATAGFFLTAVIWVNEATRLYFILRAMDIEVNLGSVIVASSIAAIVGGFLPGGAGNAAIITTILAGSGMSQSDATTAGFVMVLTSIWIAIPMGSMSSFVCKIDMHLGELVGDKKKDNDKASEGKKPEELEGVSESVEDIGEHPPDSGEGHDPLQPGSP